MKAAGKVMLVVAMVLALGMVAASDLSAAQKNQAPSTSGAVWTNDGSSSIQQPANHGKQHEQTSLEKGCFSGTASDNARCIARALANKVTSLIEGTTWGGSFGPPPR